MRRHVSYTQDFTLENGDTVELEAEFEPSHHDYIILEVGNFIIFGYLSDDQDCRNPLEDCDGYGAIHFHPRSDYGRRDSDYYEILGLDSDGGRDLNAVFSAHEEAAGQRYVKRVIEEEALADLVEWAEADYARDDDESDDVVFVTNVLMTNLAYNGWDRCQYWEIMDKVLFAMWEEPEYLPGNKDAVVLDMYDHGGIWMSISGQGMQCRWDTSRGIAVWIPDACALDEIERRAKVYDHAPVEDTKGLMRSKYMVRLGDKVEASDDWAELWRMASDYASVSKAIPKYNGRQLAAEELCQQALDQYNAWGSGDCWGVVVQVHERDGTLVETDHCWGHIGSEWAEEALADEVKGTVAIYTDRGPNPNPNQMALGL